MFCSFCGKEIDEDMKFCPHCGKANVTMQVNPKQNVEAEATGFSPGQPKERGQPQKQANEWTQANSAPAGTTNWKGLIKGLTSIRATANDVHSICSSRLSQVFCVLLTVSLLLQIVSHHGIIAIITILPRIVICAGCWITCSESRRRDGETLGLSLISGGITVYLAVFAVAGGICALAGVVLVIRGIFTIWFWSTMIIFALIGAVLGVLSGLLGAVLVLFCKNEIAEKAKQDKRGYARYAVVRCVVVCVVIALIFGLLYCTNQNNPGGFCFLLFALISCIPIYYWYCFRSIIVSAGKIMRGESSEWRGNSDAVVCLLIVAGCKIFVFGFRSVILNGLYSFTQEEFFAEFPEAVADFFWTSVFSRFIPSRLSSAAGLMSLAVVICAIILIWRITRIGKSNTRSNTQEHP